MARELTGLRYVVVKLLYSRCSLQTASFPRGEDSRKDLQLRGGNQ